MISGIRHITLHEREDMISKLKSLLGLNTYQPLNLIEVSRENLISNYKYLSSLNSKIKIAPVLKSNAYGHGLVQVAKIMDSQGCPFFCVDSLYEAYELLKARVKTPVLIMGYTDPQNFKVKKLSFSYTVFSSEILPILNKYQPGCGIHIFVDTGMHREGIPLDGLPEFLEHLKQFPNLKIEGLMSHLASADDKKDPLNKIQLKNLKKSLEILGKHGIKPKWIHLSNSDALLNPTVSTYHTPGVIYAHTVHNMARVGLALYGIYSDPNLRPILILKSKLIQIKKMKKGERVGYGGIFTARKPMVLGILPLGYYDGVDRRLSNKGYVLVEGVSCPIIGKVSMNITTIDLSYIPYPYIGQEVIVYSNNSKDKNSILKSAEIAKTIPYELLVHLTPSTRRTII